jgi:hypothetical protein
MADDPIPLSKFRKQKKLKALQSEETPTADARPRLLVDRINPNVTVAAMKDVLAHGGGVFERSAIVRIAEDKDGNPIAHPLKPAAIVVATHRVSRPYVIKRTETGLVEINTDLPAYMAQMYAAYHDWGLPPLNGIVSAPLILPDGGLQTAKGYDSHTGMYSHGCPDIAHLVPACPTYEQAASSLMNLRRAHRTLSYADASTLDEKSTLIVDLTKPPGMDESTFLTALLTGVSRPSLSLAPGRIIRGPQISGSAGGKGLIFKCICMIAYGRYPMTIAQTSTKEELDKQVTAALVNAYQAILLDNFNDCILRSSVLSSALTEEMSHVRPMRTYDLERLNPSCFPGITGNNLSPSEDLIRRLLSMNIDPQTEDPELRIFPCDLLADLKRNRERLLIDALTIIRFGMQAKDIKRGRPLGSYNDWARMCRDPLLALGCQDAVVRIGAMKTQDPRRKKVAEVFSIWWSKYGSAEVKASDVDLTVVRALDLPKTASRQKIQNEISGLAATRINGFHLVRLKKKAKWSADKYRLEETGKRHEDVEADTTEDRDTTENTESYDVEQGGWERDSGQ